MNDTGESLAPTPESTPTVEQKSQSFLQKVKARLSTRTLLPASFTAQLAIQSQLPHAIGGRGMQIAAGVLAGITGAWTAKEVIKPSPKPSTSSGS